MTNKAAIAPFIILLFVAMSMTYAMYALSIEYVEYRTYAETELAELDIRIDELRNTCNQILGEPFYSDSGNNYGN